MTTAAGTDNAYDGVQTLSIHPMWMWDAVSSGLQLIHDTMPSFEIGTENRLKANLSFVSDFRGFVEKFA